MPPTAVVECCTCRGLLLIAVNQKTKICPYCGKRVVLGKARRLATGQDSFEASEIVKKLKAARKSNTRAPEQTNRRVLK